MAAVALETNKIELPAHYVEEVLTRWSSVGFYFKQICLKNMFAKFNSIWVNILGMAAIYILQSHEIFLYNIFTPSMNLRIYW